MANTRGIKAGRAYVELGVGDKLTAGLKRAQKRLRVFGAGVMNIGTKLAGLGAAMTAPLLGAALAAYSYNWLFAASTVVSLMGLVAMRWWVKEPRWTGVEVSEGGEVGG